MGKPLATRGLFGIPVGLTYVLAMGVCGNVLIGIGDTLVDLAENVGSTSTAIASVFLVQGLAQVTASFYAPALYRNANGDAIIFVGLVVIVGIWIWGASITQKSMLYFWFFCVGLTVTTVDTGTQIMMRRVYQNSAGPWLTGISFAFTASGLMAPLLSYVASDLTMQYAMYAVVASCTAVLALLNVLRKPTPLPGAGRSARSDDDEFLDEDEPVSLLAASFLANTDMPMPRAISVERRSSGFFALQPVTPAEAAVAVATGHRHSLFPPPAASTGAAHAGMRALSVASGAPGEELKHELLDWETPPAGDYAVAASDKASGRAGSGKGANGSGGGGTFVRDFFAGLYATEFLLASMIFCGIGAQAQCSSYLETFIDDTGVIPADQASLLLSCFWGSMMVGNALAMFRQMDVTTVAIHREIYLFAAGCAVASLPLVYGGLTGQYFAWQAWLTVISWGVIFGPVFGYIFDLSNRICRRTEEGPAILIFGLNLGSSTIPMTMVSIWDAGAGPVMMPLTLLLGVGAIAMLNAILPTVNRTMRGALKGEEVPPPEYAA